MATGNFVNLGNSQQCAGNAITGTQSTFGQNLGAGGIATFSAFRKITTEGVN